MVIHDLGAEATDIERLRITGFIWRRVGSTRYRDEGVICYIDDSSDHRYGTFVYRVWTYSDIMTWSIARLKHRDDDKEDVVWDNGETYTLHEIIPALTRGGYHGAKQIASYMMKCCDLEKESKNEE